MDKALMAAVKAMVNGGDGVTVSQEDAGLQVGFGFSNNLVNKIKKVEGAQWDKENGVWNVPEASAAKLVEVVMDMRDFVRDNGVQMVTAESGDVQVLFDYNKEMTQLIGAVAGAKFDSQARVWNVPADSKALVVPEGQSSSYLDMAVNKMRGVAIETAKDHAEIKELAAASVAKLGVNAHTIYPEKDFSYTGPIMNVNGHYAAQHANADPEKGRAGFMVIHSLADLGQGVFKGADLRIDYDEKRQVGVRSTEVFKQQQQERAALTALAAEKVDGAKVLHASMQDGAKHVGSVIEVTDHFVLQHGGRNDFKIHGRDALGGAEVVKGQQLQVTYKGGKGTAVDLDKAKEGKSVAR